jgi:hypothetical protein
MKHLLVFTSVMIFGCQSSEKKREPEDLKSISKSPKENKITFNGTWRNVQQDTNNSFTIKLYQIEDSIYGNYCAVYYKGDRLDCGSGDSDFNISGRIKAYDSVLVDFDSFFDGVNGIASLKM